jgi:hypothetical protein
VDAGAELAVGVVADPAEDSVDTSSVQIPIV